MVFDKHLIANTQSVMKRIRAGQWRTPLGVATYKHAQSHAPGLPAGPWTSHTTGTLAARQRPAHTPCTRHEGSRTQGTRDPYSNTITKHSFVTVVYTTYSQSLWG